MKKETNADEIYFVVRNGEIVFRGSEEECGKIIEKDMTGELEIYPASARCARW